jgi:hypothetical protein
MITKLLQDLHGFHHKKSQDLILGREVRILFLREKQKNPLKEKKPKLQAL